MVVTHGFWPVRPGWPGRTRLGAADSRWCARWGFESPNSLMESLISQETFVSNEQEACEAGRMYKRCGCRDEATGRQRGARCPTLAEPGHGRWYFAVQVPGVDGRQVRVRRGGYASRAEAERACWEVRGLPSPQALVRTWTVRRWLEFWLSEVEGRLRPSTVRSYRTIVYQHLIPELGRERLSKLRTVQVQRTMDVISRRRVRDGRLISPGTVNRIRAVLRSALNEARRRGMIGQNPAWRLRLPDGARPHAVVWVLSVTEDADVLGVARRCACR
jgi:Phage integrase, N-terminal SAM-like domain